MKTLKDKALIGVAGIVAIALIVTSGIIPGTSASPTGPSFEDISSDPTVTTEQADTPTVPVQETETDDGTDMPVETGQADSDPDSAAVIPLSYGAAVIRASFTVGDPN